MTTPEEPIRLAVAGLGRAFTLMLPTLLADPRVRLVAACDPRREARAQFAADFNAPAHEDIDALVRDKNVEAIYVASPHQFHAPHAQAAAAAGKHVLLEKPMALTLAECDAITEACRSANVQLIIGHCHSFDTPYLKVRELIDCGAYGQVRMVHALNYTDYLYRPRRPEELSTASGGGAAFSQAAHQIDVVRLLAGSPVVRVRAATGAWDARRNTEGAYALLLWFADGAFASLTYSGYGHFDSDEWCGWIGEMGNPRHNSQHGAARKRLAQATDAATEAQLKNASTYGGPAYKPPPSGAANLHQHFGPVLVSCDRADLRPLPDGVWVYGDEEKLFHPLGKPSVPRHEVIDELFAALRHGKPPLHDGPWARATLEVSLALLRSAQEQRDIELAGS
jgi:phthalate 4,5-cis-dihydrodiol dehydrogenase